MKYAFFFTLLTCLAGISCTTESSTNKSNETRQALDGNIYQPVELKDFVLYDMNDSAHQINPKNFTFINLWATWCSPCVKEMPAIDSLKNKFSGKLDFYFASYEKPERVKHFAQNPPAHLPFYYYSELSLPKELESSALPFTLILYNNKVLFEKTGATEWNSPAIINQIDSLLMANQ